MGEGLKSARLPKVAAWDRGPTLAILCALPVEDEVDPAPVVVLHREDELEKALTPTQRPREPCHLPQIAVQLERAGGIIDAGDTLVAGFPGRHGVACRISIDGDGERPVSR